MTQRARHYDPDAMQREINEYFERCDAKGEPYTVSGMAIALGFCDRKTLHEYEIGDKPMGCDDETRARFRDAIKGAKFRIESQRESALYSGSGSTIGTIFGLKAHFGWDDGSRANRGEGVTVQIATFDPRSVASSGATVSITTHSPAICATDNDDGHEGS